MRLIKPSFEIFEQGPGLQGIYEAIERAGRTCYKSEAKYQYKDIETGEIFQDIPEADDYVIYTSSFEYNKNTGEVKNNPKVHYLKRESTTAKGFVDRMIASKHYAMLEHGTVYLTLPNNSYGNEIHHHYILNPYSTENSDDFGRVYITTNFRVLVENGWLDDLKYLCEPTDLHERRVTVKFTTDIGVSREANRHRVDSIAEQSTRYCNYSREKFGNQITILHNEDIPSDEYFDSVFKWSRGDIKSAKSAFRTMCGEIYNFKEDQFSIVELWLFGNAASEFAYMELLKRGWTPQQARRVLPLDLHTELIHTAFVSDWEHFFDLRAKGTTGAPHPDMKALAEPLMHEFENRKLIY